MSNFNLTLSPTQIEYLMKPGIIITQAYEVTNNSDQDIFLNTQVLPFIPQGNGGSVTYQNVYPNPNVQFSLNNSNLELNKPFKLPAKSKQQLVLKINTLNTSDLNDAYYTFFIFQNQQNYTNYPQATGRIGSHILLTLTDKEEVQNQGEITQFITQPKIKDVLLTPIHFQGEVKNNSNHFFKTEGKITVTKNEKIIKELEIKNTNVLSHYYRQIECQEESICSLEAPFWPGKYTATLTFNPNLNIKAQSTSFYVFPLSPLLLLLFLITPIILFKIIKNKFKKTN